MKKTFIDADMEAAFFGLFNVGITREFLISSENFSWETKLMCGYGKVST